MDKHTPGPWEYFPAQNYEGFAIAPKGTLPTLAACERHIGSKISIRCFNFPGSTEANARRIVACVNYCEGLDGLELLKKPLELQAERDKLLAENKELVEALKPFASIFDRKNPPAADYYVKNNGDYAWGFNSWTVSWSAFISARDILARLK